MEYLGVAAIILAMAVLLNGWPDLITINKYYTVKDDEQDKE